MDWLIVSKCIEYWLWVCDDEVINVLLKKNIYSIDIRRLKIKIWYNYVLDNLFIFWKFLIDSNYLNELKIIVILLFGGNEGY